ncbi:AlpA family phage regulatory protein [bacterium]|nr:AlpA family phage regulatory protein [bacterium]
MSTERLRIDDVADILNCSRCFVYRQIRLGLVPPPRKIGRRYSFWLRDEIEKAARGLEWRDEPENQQFDKQAAACITA